MIDRLARFAQSAKYVLLLGIILAFAGSIYAVSHGPLPAGESLEAEPQRLPIYAAWSLLRMTVAFVAALLFSIAYGYVAATSRRAERILMPLLDILQSVPVLGFFPAATFVFVRLSHGGRIGFELASIFLIFTSQAWNIAFGVYEAITTIPQDSLDALSSFGVRGLRRFRLLYLPACVPKLVYNSILSWAGGWYFLIACEIITDGPMAHPLPGLGTFLTRASDAGRTGWIVAGITVLVLIIVTMDVFIWRPLGAWAEKYRYEFAASTVRHSLALDFWRRSRLGRGLRRLGHAVLAPLDGLIDRLSPATPPDQPRSPPRRIGGAIVLVGLCALGAWLLFLAGVALVHVLAWPWPREAALIPPAIGASFLRLLAAYIIALAWTVPLTAWATDRPRAMRVVQPLAQIGASVPATALFPLIVAVVVRHLGGREVASVLLVLTGMQWYLLFNLIGGAQSIPGDLKEASRAFGMRGRRYFRTLLLPAMIPSLVTGSITGWGGGWNALIVSEYFVYEKKPIEVFGIGALLDHATYGGSPAMTVLTLFSMVTVIVLMNRFFWRRAYARAADRFKVEY
jgi:NitT/TauT family transport system permease protein